METQPDPVDICPVMLEKRFKQIAQRFKLLSDPSRLQILSAICNQERNVTEICKRTRLNQANVSKHLQLLKCSGVVACRRVGNCRYYRIIDNDLLSLCAKSLLEIEQLSLPSHTGGDIHVQNSIQDYAGLLANRACYSRLPSDGPGSAGTSPTCQSCSGD
ncbi:ArsR/SmtB family transcription factor [Leptolyngbya sp. Heron Island J]|uniref:ArsR/SmtB family transcription factor n=1 Tax=Leptolyngbya sp. Heron Island J TaxID=1385935 RepID=UPI0009DD3DA8|nr:metalloregulator ArsR/SmtB family transcription factor [Leptolyngbya sp. Heron Island J]